MADLEAERRLSLKMEELDRERLVVKHQLDRERLTKITGNLIDTITSPAFVERMRAFRQRAAGGASFSEAGDLMSLENLRAAGAEIPDDFRLTSRVFEDREAGFRVEFKPPSIDDLRASTGGGVVAWGACAGGGAATVCGCAGGST